ncbi:MAG: ABC transporter ATP-binding protein/permease [Chloroflexi bacterium]|nr:ABC transporter ATP-binding protein/permease [Chloroflexota bacterium]
MEGQKSKNTKAVLLRLWGYLRRRSGLLIGIILLVIASSAIDLLGPYLMGRAIDEYIGKGNLAGLARMLLLMVAAYAAASLLVWLQSYLAIGLSMQVVRDLREDLFSRMQRLPLRYFDAHSHGDTMSRLTNDVDNVSNTLSTSLSQLVSSLFTLVGVIVVIFSMNVPLALVSLIVMPLTVVMTRIIAKRTRRGFRENQRTLGELNGIIEESVSGERTIQAFGREEKTIEQFSAVNNELRRVALRARIPASFMGPVMNMINNLGLTIVAASGGYLAVRGMASVGTVAAFVNYAGRLGRPLNQIASLFTSIQSALAGAERVFELMDELPESDASNARALPHVKGKVVFDNVCFGYEPNVPVLKSVSLSAEPGQLVALVGPTGAGKTTIANLLTRFYDIDAGAITIDDQDVRTLKKDDLRRKLGLVLQDNFLFTGSVMENIRYGRREASDDEVVAAAVLANADSFIQRLPHGYQTPLTERGSNLSQGQRQLMAIARAVLADPDILILDEATSNVDTRTEKHLQEALLRLMRGRTSFVIAHRLSTIRDADQVLVINDGQIIERGTHTSLLADRGFYYNLYRSQFKGQRMPETEAVASSA